MKKLLLTLSVIFFALSTTLHAQFVHNGQLEATKDNYQQYAVVNGGNSGTLEYFDPFGFIKQASAGIIGNFWDENDQRFYSWGISVAHNFMQGGLYADRHVFLTGTNYFTDRGQEVVVTEFHLHPGYTGVGPHSVDIALFKLSDALPVSNLTVAAGSVGDILTYASFGRPGTPATGLLPHDGYGKAFEGRIDGFGNAGTASFYTQSFFNPPSSGYYRPLGGLATGGGSGSFGYNQNGELVTILALGTGGSPGYFNASYGVHVADFDIPQWLSQFVGTPPSPTCPVAPSFPHLVNICADVQAVEETVAISTRPCPFPNC